MSPPFARERFYHILNFYMCFDVPSCGNTNDGKSNKTINERVKRSSSIFFDKFFFVHSIISVFYEKYSQRI